MNKVLITVMMAFVCQAGNVMAQQNDEVLPAQLPPIPDIPTKQAVNSVKMADSNTFMEVNINLPITDGPFKPNWESIEKNYPGTPQWLRDSKFGIWVHFGPQSAGGRIKFYRNCITKPLYRC